MNDPEEFRTITNEYRSESFGKLKNLKSRASSVVHLNLIKMDNIELVYTPLLKSRIYLLEISCNKMSSIVVQSTKELAII